MKRRGAVLAFACTVLAATCAMGAPKSVSVPPGALTDALESLARQYGVDIIYPSSSLHGQTTHGVSGTLEPVDAFRKLLEGTSLALREEEGALLVTQSVGDLGPEAVRSLLDAVPEVQIEASREKLSGMRAELVRLEDEFFAAYNKVNEIRDYNVNCERARQGGVAVHRCRPVFQIKGEVIGANAAQNTIGYDQKPFSFVFGYQGSDLSWQLRIPDYQKHMIEIVSQHPELQELLKERRALAARYDVVRRTKFKGKLFVWD
jgi:hypothetical protein